MLNTPDGGVVRQTTLSPGMMFGELSIIGESMRTAAVGLALAWEVRIFLSLHRGPLRGEERSGGGAGSAVRGWLGG